MNHTRRALAILAATLAAGVTGYWLGHNGLVTSALMPATGAAQTNALAPFGPIIYYRDPDGRPLYSLESKTTPDGRPYRAVLASEDISFDSKAATAMPAESGGRRILYYRNPMGLPDTSPVPKKDWMGMDYIPVYEGEEQGWVITDLLRPLLCRPQGQPVEGEVTFIYPELRTETRTARVRIELPNPDGRLKIDMYADVVFQTGMDEQPAVTVPASAVIDSGTRQVVLVAKGEGRFESRAIKLGRRGDGYVEILDGLKEGEEVVTSATFLIDAESNLKAALEAFTQVEAPK